jgi:NAD+ kinase
MHLGRIADAESKQALEKLDVLRSHYDLVPVEEADVIIVLGGDGFMLDSMHRFRGRKLPIYGMNRGTVGFLMNEFREETLIERINAARPQRLFPLQMTVTDTEGQVREALAFNEVAMVRYSQQTANLRIVIDGKVRMEKLMSDGVLVCTPAGSTAYNLSVHGPVIPRCYSIMDIRSRSGLSMSNLPVKPSPTPGLKLRARFKHIRILER